MAETARVEHVHDAGLAASRQESRAGDQHGPGTREIGIAVVERQPVARGEPVHTAQTVGRVELEHTLTEVMNAVIAGTVVAITGEDVDKPRAIDDRRTAGLPLPGTAIAGGHGRKNAG